MSSTGAEWVSAPTDMASTPVSAMARTLWRPNPARGFEPHDPVCHGDRPAKVGEGKVIKHDDVRREGQRLGELLQRIHLDLDGRQMSGHGLGAT